MLHKICRLFNTLHELGAYSVELVHSAGKVEWVSAQPFARTPRPGMGGGVGIWAEVGFMLSFAAVASERYLAYEETKTHKRRKPGHRIYFYF